MRELGAFADEKEAHLFCDFLSKKEGIACRYEAYQDVETKKHAVRVWLEDEDDLTEAKAWYQRFKQGPQDFILGEELPIVAVHPVKEEIAPEVPLSRKRFRLKVAVRPRAPKLTLVNVILMLCIFLFFWTGFQSAAIDAEKGVLVVENTFTPLVRKLLFDYPAAFVKLEEVMDSLPLKSYSDFKEVPPSMQAQIKQAEAIPYWKGVYDYLVEKYELNAPAPPMFEKIRQGEFWRLFTPVLLHGGFLHILFNMAWLWVLGRQIEERLSILRMILMILIIGVVSNVVQYLMGGPFFLGFSGVVVGMAGFIWMRQRVAPWEGYPLQRAVALFLLIFVLAMGALELVSFLFQHFTKIALSAQIANTAHVVGGLVGLLLGRFSFFARKGEAINEH